MAIYEYINDFQMFLDIAQVLSEYMASHYVRVHTSREARHNFEALMACLENKYEPQLSAYPTARFSEIGDELLALINQYLDLETIDFDSMVRLWEIESGRNVAKEAYRGLSENIPIIID